MHRIEQLRPLSRQHQLGLNLGLKASQVTDELSEQELSQQWQNLVAYIHDELTDHFGVEEDYLVTPLVKDHSDNEQVKTLSNSLLQQHQELNRLAKTPNPMPSDLRALGRLLYDHIRFEEREVFPIAQQLLTAEQLKTIYDHSSPDVK